MAWADWPEAEPRTARLRSDAFLNASVGRERRFSRIVVVPVAYGMTTEKEHLPYLVHREWIQVYVGRRCGAAWKSSRRPKIVSRL